MKEILFRGKRLDNKQWVYGYYIKATNHWHKYGIHEDWIVTDTIQNGGWCNVRGKYSVNTETVGQYIGLNDKKNVKIFEGDIVRIEYPENVIVCAIIKYNGTSFYGYNNFDEWKLDNYCEIEVLGNIHDNIDMIFPYEKER